MFLTKQSTNPSIGDVFYDQVSCVLKMFTHNGWEKFAISGDFTFQVGDVVKDTKHGVIGTITEIHQNHVNLKVITYMDGELQFRSEAHWLEIPDPRDIVKWRTDHGF